MLKMINGILIKTTWEQWLVTRHIHQLAVGLPGLLVVAGDTRISQGYSIISRETSKIA
jgi:hypothetical protein